MIKLIFKNADIFRGIFPWLVTALICLCITVYAPIADAGQSGPAEVIKKFNAVLTDAMKRAKELGYPGRYKLIEPVFRDSFAISYMAGISVGKTWKTINDKEKQLLLDTYTEWSVATYAGRFNEYSGQKFEIVSESKPVQDTVTVISKLVGADKEETDFYYKLRKMEGKWLIVDIQISGVSQLALTRSQFVNVINTKGFNALISMLKEKINNFSQGKSE